MGIMARYLVGFSYGDKLILGIDNPITETFRIIPFKNDN